MELIIMGVTGGGRGTNQYSIKGVSKAKYDKLQKRVEKMEKLLEVHGLINEGENSNPYDYVTLSNDLKLNPPFDSYYHRSGLLYDENITKTDYGEYDVFTKVNNAWIIDQEVDVDSEISFLFQLKTMQS